MEIQHAHLKQLETGLFSHQTNFSIFFFVLHRIQIKDNLLILCRRQHFGIYLHLSKEKPHRYTPHQREQEQTTHAGFRPRLPSEHTAHPSRQAWQHCCSPQPQHHTAVLSAHSLPHSCSRTHCALGNSA